MWEYIRKQRVQITLLLILTLLSSLSNILFIYIIQNIVDALTNSNERYFKILIVYFMFFLVFNYLVGYFSTVQEAKILKNIHVELKGDLFRSLLNQKYSDFIKTTIGEKMNFFENDLEMIDQYYFKNLFIFSQSLFLLTFSLIYLLSINFLLGFILIISTAIILIIPVILSNSIDIVSDNYSKNRGNFLTQLKDFFSGIDVIKSYKIESIISKNFDQELKMNEGNLYNLKKKIGQYNSIMATGHYIIIILCFVIGGMWTLKGGVTLGQLMAVIQVMNIVIQPMSNIGSSVMEIKGVDKIRTRLEHIILKCNYNVDKTDSLKMIKFNEIKCENLNYEVKGSNFKLKNISIKIEANKKYALIGSSGSGKTTLLKMLARYIEPTIGQIYIDNNLYEEFDDNLANLISYVSQDTFIFKDSLKNNITLYQDYNEDSLDMALDKAVLTDILNNESEGIETICNESGINFSGGEKQRISIARSILRNAPILLMDEITSALDATTSKKIENNLLKLKDKTIVFVTHKIEKNFLESMDCIFCMSGGEIIESGDFKTLIQADGYLSKLYNSNYGTILEEESNG
ncbi:ABC transporter ATP-binding protein [Paraclostridium bifermentans]|uniref:ABC transporter ATP-binding protein n=1 Tax=Paraclostridium bifermentans TaxID=1490 RepID=UPI0018982560|nr:ABC transporter ATP-binding protein [Paraclostridium bifermentans]